MGGREKEKRTSERHAETSRSDVKPASQSTFYLESVWDVLLVEGIQADELEALRYDVEGLVVGFGAQSHLIGANLQGRRNTAGGKQLHHRHDTVNVNGSDS